MKAARLLLGVLLWLLVLGLTTALVSTRALRGLEASSTWLSVGILTQLLMCAASLALAAALSRGRLAEYGFRRATWREIRAAFMVGSLIAIVVQLALAVTWRLFPPAGGHPAIGGASLLRTVITVWVIASTCEEVFLRGLIQSFLSPLRESGVTVFSVRLSLPVITAATLFGAMHTMLLAAGADGLLVAGIVGSATVLGVVAGYHREKSMSLVPAILIHMLFNIYGAVAEYVQRALAD